LLEAIVEAGGVAVLDAVGELQRRQILETTPGGRLRFTHDKLREAAYDALAAGKRARMHGAAARALEARPEPERADQAAALGHHWERAGEPGRARPWYLAAARRARAQYALGEA